MNLTDLLDRPIAFHRPLVTITKSVTSALMLSQALYWSRVTKDTDGWFYKSQKEWTEETGLGRVEQENAREILLARGVWEERYERLAHRMWYRVDTEKLSRMLETHIRESDKPTFGTVGNSHSSNGSETTTETTDREIDLFAEKESESIKTSSPIKKKLEPIPFEKLFTGKLLNFPDFGQFADAWVEFVADRKERRKAMTTRAAKMILAKLAEHPEKAVFALKCCIEKGWTSFEWAWLPDLTIFHKGRAHIDVDMPPKPIIKLMPTAKEQRESQHESKHTV